MFEKRLRNCVLLFAPLLACFGRRASAFVGQHIGRSKYKTTSEAKYDAQRCTPKLANNFKNLHDPLAIDVVERKSVSPHTNCTQVHGTVTHNQYTD